MFETFQPIVLSYTVFQVYFFLWFGEVSLLVSAHTDQNAPLPYYYIKRFLRRDHDLPSPTASSDNCRSDPPALNVTDQIPHTEKTLTGSIVSNHQIVNLLLSSCQPNIENPAFTGGDLPPD